MRVPRLAPLAAALALACSSAPAQSAAAPRPVPVDFLRELTLAQATAGDEGGVRAILRRYIGGAAATAETAKGDLVVRLPGTAPHPIILVAAHMDEVGFQVSSITPEGFLRLAPLGIWYSGSILDHQVTVSTLAGRLPGVVGVDPPHLMSAAERVHAPAISDLYVDIGASSAAGAARMGVRPGDRVAPAGRFLRMGDRLVSKAWDDRVGCALLADTVRSLSATAHPNTVVFAWTTGEETGRSNATVELPDLRPDFVLVVEVGLTRDTPGGAQPRQETLGGGPVLDLYDGAIATPPAIRDWFVRQAEAAAIPLQQTTITFDGAGVANQNGSYLYRAPATALLVPLRYAHAPNGVIDGRDYQQTRDLLLHLLTRLDAAALDRMRGSD